MKNKNIIIKKTCSFYVSEYHLVTMLLPYIKQKIEEKSAIKTLLEESIKSNMETLIAGINLSDDDKEKILNLNWQKTIPYKYEAIEEQLNQITNRTENMNIIVSGNSEYINLVNKNIEKWLKKTNKNIKNITINNCYEVIQFNANINEILDKHDKILNTSGEQEIEEIFAGYKKTSDISLEKTNIGF